MLLPPIQLLPFGFRYARDLEEHLCFMPGILGRWKMATAILMLHREISGCSGQTYLWQMHVVNTVCGQSVDSR